MSRASASPAVQLDWRLEALLRDGSLTKDRSASRNSNEAEKVFEFVSIDDGAAQFQKRYDKTKSPEENAKSLIAATSGSFVDKTNKPEEAEGLVIEGGAAAVRARLESTLASKVAQKPAVTSYAARLKLLEELEAATRNPLLADLPQSCAGSSAFAPPEVGATCRIEDTGRKCKIVALKGPNKLVVDLDENEGDDGDAFEQVTVYRNTVTDFNPPRRRRDNWADRFKHAAVGFNFPAKKPKTKKWSDYAQVCAKAALDAHKATADKDSDAARDADDKALKDLARSYYCALAAETEALVLELVDAFKGDQDAIREWLAPCAARAALKFSAKAKTASDASVLVEAYKKAEAKRIWVMRRSKLTHEKGPTGDERAPRNLYYQYVYQLYRAGNLDPACPFERLTGLKKDAENPPNFFL